MPAVDAFVTQAVSELLLDCNGGDQWELQSTSASRVMEQMRSGIHQRHNAQILLLRLALRFIGWQG